MILAELNADLFSHHSSPLEFMFLWPSTKEVKMLCPTRFVVDATENSKVDATENSKKEAWRPKCAAPTLFYYSVLFFEIFMHVYVRTTYH